MKCILAFFFCTLAWGASIPRIVYTKSFPGSVPPFIEITLDKSGAGEYKEAADDPDPLKFRLNEADVNEVFGLTEKVDYFRRPLESPLKVAFMGKKTFRYESGAEKTEVQFNYSEDLSARALADWFEKIAESEQRLIDLERTAKYDKLGVMQSLLQLEVLMDKKRIVAPQQYLPMLDRIVKNETYLHQARLRAANLADQIRAAKP